MVYVELSPLMGAGRYVFFYHQPVATESKFVGRACGRLAWRIPPNPDATSVQCTGYRGIARPFALPVAAAAGRCRQCNPVEQHQGAVFSRDIGRRVPLRAAHRQGRTRHLAAPVLGTSDSKRERFCRACELHPFQSGQTRPCNASSRLAVFVVS